MVRWPNGKALLSGTERFGILAKIVGSSPIRIDLFAFPFVDKNNGHLNLPTVEVVSVDGATHTGRREALM